MSLGMDIGHEEPRARLFRSWTEPVIAALVVAHLVLGIAAALPSRSRLWHVPVLGSLAAWYASHNLDQQWSMFSPPPRRRQSIQYALRFADGWTDLIALDPYTSEVTGRLVQPPGAFRLIVHLRATNGDSIPGGLSDRSARAHYYQELADYFCRGAGRIPDLVAIRFYLVAHTPPHFFETDQYGQPLPPPTDFDAQLALYEQECAAS
jgi:hypothetical protein